MDWSNERYVRVYTRDTTSWKLMDWRGRVVLQLLLRKVDRAGVLDVGHDGVLGLAAVLELPLEIAEAGIEQLTTSRGGLPTVVDTGTAYVLPNFLEAQEAPQADAQRKRESRSRRRDVALAVSRNLLLPAAGGTSGHETGRNRPVESQQVTPIRSDPSRSDPELSLPRAIPAPPEPAPAPAPTPAVPLAPSDPDPALAARRRVQLELRADLERERREVAAELGVADHGLLAQDPGERELAMHLVAAGPDGLAAARSQALHAIAMAGLEARKKRELRWLTGAIFGERNFRRLVAMTAAEAKRVEPTKPGARGDPAPTPARRPDSGPKSLPPPTLSAEEQAEIAEMARRAAANPAAAVEVLGAGQRAPPARARAIDDQQPQPGKATAT